MGGEANSVHRDKGIVSIMGINHHPLFIYRQLADAIHSSYIYIPHFADDSTQRRMAHIHYTHPAPLIPSNANAIPPRRQERHFTEAQLSYRVKVKR